MSMVPMEPSNLRPGVAVTRNITPLSPPELACCPPPCAGLAAAVAGVDLVEPGSAPGLDLGLCSGPDPAGCGRSLGPAPCLLASPASRRACLPDHSHREPERRPPPTRHETPSFLPE